MTNNPKIIEKIKKQIKSTTKEQLQRAIKLVDEEYENMKIELKNNSMYCIEEKYKIFNIHKKKTSSIFNIFKKSKIKERNKELEAA